MKKDAMALAVFAILLLNALLMLTRISANGGTECYAVSGNYVLMLITPDGAMTVVCEFPIVNPYSVDNEYLTIDSSGNYILPDYLNHKLYKVTPDGVWSTIYYFSKGTGPVAVRIDSSGNYIVTEYDASNLSKITPSGVRTVICRFPLGNQPADFRIDSSGNYIVCETEADILSKVTPNGVRTIVYRFPQETHPFGLAIDSSGNYIVVERTNALISKITPSGERTVIWKASAPGRNPIGVVCTTLAKKPTATEAPIIPILAMIVVTVVTAVALLVLYIRRKR